MNIIYRSLSGALLAATVCAVSGQTVMSGFELGLQAFTRGDYSSAEAAFTRALEQDPRSADTYYYLGLSSLNTGNTETAVGALRRAVALDPTLPGAQTNLGIGLFKLKLYASAESALQKAIAEDPDDASAALFLGLAAQATGRDADAIQAFEKAARLDPDYGQLALYNAGITRARSGDTDKARADLRRAIAIDSKTDTAANARDFLSTLDGATTAPTPTARRWSFSAAAGVEYDDNVTVSDVDFTSAEQDEAALFDVSIAYQAYKSADTEVEIGYDFSQSLYSSLTEFDLQSHTGSLYASRDFGNVDGDFGYRYTYTSLGGTKFLESHTISPAVSFTTLPQWYHRITYSFQDKNFFQDNDRDADQHAIASDNYYFFMDSKAYALLGGKLVNEDTSGAQFEYFGYYFNAGLSMPLEIAGLQPKLGLRYQYYLRDYDNITPSIGEEREDKRHTVTVALEHRLWKNFKLKLNYQYIDAISNLPSSDFNENIVSLSIETKL